MDPNITLLNMILAAKHGDRDAYQAAADDLYDWLAKGGFAPVTLNVSVD